MLPSFIKKCDSQIYCSNVILTQNVKRHWHTAKRKSARSKAHPRVSKQSHKSFEAFGTERESSVTTKNVKKRNYFWFFIQTDSVFNFENPGTQLDLKVSNRFVMKQLLVKTQTWAQQMRRHPRPSLPFPVTAVSTNWSENSQSAFMLRLRDKLLKCCFDFNVCKWK